MDIFRCSFCNSDLSTRYNLMKHMERCKVKKQVDFEKKVHEIRSEYETRLQAQNRNYELHLESQKEQYESQLQTLRDQIESQAEKIDKLENQIFEIARQPKQINTHHTTTTNNQRTVNIINQLAPYHLDTEEIQQILLERFTPEVFNGGPEKIAEVTAKFLLTDPETQKRRVVCTDSSRRVYRYIDPVSNELQLDPGFQKTHKIIKRPLEQANLNLFLEKYAKNDVDDEYRDVWKRNDEFIEDQHRFPDKLFQYLK